MKIGDLELGTGAGLAPMAGVTDAPARLLAFEQGARYAVSEMMSAKGYLYAPENSRAVRDLLRREPGEGIGGLQLFGREPGLMAKAAERLQDAGFSFIDVNMGCPAHKIVSNGEGSALMREPELVGRIVYAMRRAIHLPLTVKMRAGWDADSVNAPLIAKICEDNGADALFIHPRTREQQYAGQADWRVIAEVKRVCRVPIIGNGDVRSGADALRMRAETGCDGVLVGRASQGNPWIFAEINAALSGLAYAPPTAAERVAMARRHMAILETEKPADVAMREMRKHIAWYISGLPGSARLRERVNRVTHPDEARELLDEYARLGL